MDKANKSDEKDNSTFEEIYLDNNNTIIDNNKTEKNTTDTQQKLQCDNADDEQINRQTLADISNSSESLEKISCTSATSTDRNATATKTKTDEANNLNADNKLSEAKNSTDESGETKTKQFLTKETNRYGGIYVEISEYPETNGEDINNNNNNSADNHKFDNNSNSSDSIVKEVPLGRELKEIMEETQRIQTSGVLEGMDPETGNYIRTNKAKDSPNVEDSNQLTVKSNEMGRSLRRGWSKRLVSTLSNRNRRPDDSDEEDDGADNCIFGNQIRFTIMIISTLCLSSILSNILTFNFTFICMAGPQPANFSNMTEEEIKLSGYRPDLDYSSARRSILFMAVAVGALLAVFPLTIALNKIGSRMVFGVLGYISAISTLLIPMSANLGFPFILIMRVIQGIGFSSCLPVMGSITSHWSTLKQNGIFIAILSSFLQIAPIFTMPISGALCTSSLGWESVYYLHGVVCIFVFTMFIFYHRNSPNKHPLMQRKELVKVMFGKGSIYGGPGKQKKSRKVPYEALYRDTAIWAILVAAIGNFMGTQLSLQFMPTYINKVLFLPIEQTGMASAISPVIMFFIKLLAGQSSDRITFISDNCKLRIYNTLSMGLMGVFFIMLALLNPHEQKSLCLMVLILSTCILGFNSGGFFKSSQMVSRQHSHFTLANISFINCVCMLIVPLLNELIAPENTPETWAIVLWIHGIILITTNIFFCFLASGKPAPWTMDSWKHSSRRSRRKRAIAPKPMEQPQNGFNNV